MKINNILEFIYPNRCPRCDCLLEHGIKVCDACRMQILYVREPCCFRCGKEVFDEETEYCKDCMDREWNYIKGFPAINYIDPLPHSLARFKYKNCRQYASFYADEILRSKGRQILAVSPDVFVPVPVHRKRKRKRGYNQAELLARALGKRLHIPVDTEILCRNINTMPQKELGQKLRTINLSKAFQPGKKIVEYNKVMLVDDIYTTGATIDTCAAVLKRCGCKEIYYTSVCIGKL